MSEHVRDVIARLKAARRAPAPEPEPLEEPAEEPVEPDEVLTDEETDY